MRAVTVPVLLAFAFLPPIALVPPASAAGNAENGAAVFRKCMPCHRVGPGARTLVGPELNGVVGRKAGSVEGYPYSKAMLGSGVTFDEATLAEYLKAPRAMIPKINMAFPGLRKDQDIADLIAYLKTFKPDGSPASP